MRMKKIISCATGMLLTFSILGTSVYAGKLPISVNPKMDSANKHINTISSSTAHKVVKRNKVSKKQKEVIKKETINNIDSNKNNNITSETLRPNNCSSNLINDNANNGYEVSGINNLAGINSMVDSTNNANVNSNINVSNIEGIEPNANTSNIVNVRPSFNVDNIASLELDAHTNNTLNVESEVNMNNMVAESLLNKNTVANEKVVNINNNINNVPLINAGENEFNNNIINSNDDTNEYNNDLVTIKRPLRYGYFQVPRQRENVVRQNIRKYMGIFNSFIKDKHWENIPNAGFGKTFSGIFNISPRFIDTGKDLKIKNVITVKVPVYDKEHKLTGEYNEMLMKTYANSEEQAKMLIFLTFLPEEICLMDEKDFYKVINVPMIETVYNYFYRQ